MSRKVIREAFGALLDAALAGSGNPVQTVYDYVATDFGGTSPVVALGAAGSARTLAGRGGTQARHYLDAMIFVLRGEAGNATYTEAEADDRLDEIEAALLAVIEANQDNANWDAVDYAGQSTIDAVEIGGEQYWMERIPLQFDVY